MQKGFCLRFTADPCSFHIFRGEKMDSGSRYEAHTILTQLLDPASRTFDPALARDLIAIIPLVKKIPWSLSLAFKKQGGGQDFMAAGIGKVRLEEEGKEKRFDANKIEPVAVGQWRLMHTPGRILISHMWADTYEDPDGREFLLSYDRNTGEPKNIKKAELKQASFLGGALQFSLTIQVPFKTPETPKEHAPLPAAAGISPAPK